MNINPNALPMPYPQTATTSPAPAPVEAEPAPANTNTPNTPVPTPTTTASTAAPSENLAPIPNTLDYLKTLNIITTPPPTSTTAPENNKGVVIEDNGKSYNLVIEYGGYCVRDMDDPKDLPHTVKSVELVYTQTTKESSYGTYTEETLTAATVTLEDDLSYSGMPRDKKIESAKLGEYISKLKDSDAEAAKDIKIEKKYQKDGNENSAKPC